MRAKTATRFLRDDFHENVEPRIIRGPHSETAKTILRAGQHIHHIAIQVVAARQNKSIVTLSNV